jgi:hypothetical protein
MDNKDVKKWITHISKRKRDDINEDNLIKELTYNSIQSLMNAIKKNKVNNKNLDLFLEGMEYMFKNSKETFKGEKNKDIILLVNACGAISLKIIQDIKENKNNNKKFNVVDYLTEYKKEFNVPIKHRKLNKLDIKSDLNDFIVEDRTESEATYSSDSDYDESYYYSDSEDDSSDYNITYKGKVGDFVKQLKKIVSSQDSKEEILNYFDNLKEQDQTDTINKLAEISNRNIQNIPYIFKLLHSPISNIAKKNIISKIAHPSLDGKWKKWVEDIMKIPFGVYQGLNIDNIKPTKVKKFLDKLKITMDDAVYGHDNAKKQIIQMMAQQIRNPDCKGNVIALWGPPGNGKCFALDTPILMYDGSIKKVQDIVIGDIVMGDDSTPRSVLSLGCGSDEMYEIINTNYYFDSYTVNSEHILCLKVLNTKLFENYIIKNDILEITVKEYLELSDEMKENLRGYKKPAFYNMKKTRLDPYIFGFWLNSKLKSNDILDNNILREYNLIDDKNNKIEDKLYIPDDYKINDSYVRTKILNGIILANSTIENHNNYTNNNINIKLLNQSLMNDLIYLIRSLNIPIISINDDNIIINKSKDNDYYNNEFKFDVVSKGYGDYYGFTLDKNNRFLLGNFTVTHNTSIIKEGIAKAMDRPFIFISLGGATDASFLEGHSFTYEGSIYGRIAQSLMDAKCMNPIIYFDELDKVGKCHKGEEIINLLIHLVDPVQNKLFRDKYFYDVDLDLSKVTFIFSFNEPGNISYILRDRITMIETKSLNMDMKYHIATNYLIPEICKDIGFKDKITFNNEVIKNIIDNYTNEGGVRKLKEHLYRIMREINHVNLIKGKIGNKEIKFPFEIGMDIYDDIFKNKPKYIHLTVHKKDGIGMVNGLWANSLGQGGVLPIESVLIPSKEVMSIKATGSLGDVIKESIEVALSVAWNKLDNNMKMQWMDKWKNTPECFHIHCPDGSTGKEGPSAGAAMTLAFYSRLTNRKVKHNVAMTGEINLREEVTEIGGLDEKLNAAKRGGAALALIPFNNQIDLENVIKNNPSLIDNNFKVICVENFDMVIKYSLL